MPENNNNQERQENNRGLNTERHVLRVTKRPGGPPPSPLLTIMEGQRRRIRVCGRGFQYQLDPECWTHPNLKSVAIIRDWIPVYDHSMTSLLAESDVPHRPTVIKVDRLLIQKETDEREIKNDVYVLWCHGWSGSGFWKTNGGEKIEDLIREIQDEKYPLAGLFVCNEGSYKLPADLTHSITYVTDGKASSSFLADYDHLRNRWYLTAILSAGPGARILMPSVIK